MSDQPPMGMSDQEFLNTPPPGAGMQTPPPGPNPSGKLTPPAIFLMVIGGLGLVTALWSTVSSTLNYMNPAAVMAQQEQAIKDLEKSEIPDEWKEIAVSFLSQPPTALPIALGVVAIICSILTLLGGLSMQKQKNYGLCITGAITAMLPISACCCLGLPAGIWAIVVLMQSNVKDAFRANRG